MKIQVYPADLHGCGWYRLIFPALALKALGHEVEVVEDGTLMGNATIAQYDDRPWKLIEGELPDADVIVVQRPSHPAVEAAITYFVERGIRVVVDIDDRFDAVPPNNMAWDYYRKDPRAIQVLRGSLESASAVTVSTTDLHELHGGTLITNCIPESYLAIPDNHEQILGWAGSLSVHKDDVNIVGNSVNLALRQSGWEFRVAGVADGVKGELGLPYTPADTGWLDIHDYPFAVAQFGVAIAPIRDNKFNRAKSWLKALEYSALGVPFVASNMPEYERLGAGMLANSPRQWKGMLAALMNDADLREAERTRNREIARQHTFEGNAHKWEQVWLNQY